MLAGSSSSLSEVKVHIGVLAASVLATAVPVIGDTYGYSGSWCWINPEVPLGIFFQFATYYVPLWIIIVSVCVMYTRCVRCACGPRVCARAPDYACACLCASHACGVCAVVRTAGSGCGCTR